MVPSLLCRVENLFAGCRKERPACPSRARLAQSIRLVASASHALGRRHVKHSCPQLTTLRRVLTHRSTPPLHTQPGPSSHPTREPAVAECQPDIASQVRSVCTPDGRNDISPRGFDGTLIKGLRRRSSRVTHGGGFYDKKMKNPRVLKDFMPVLSMDYPHRCGFANNLEVLLRRSGGCLSIGDVSQVRTMVLSALSFKLKSRDRLMK